MNTLQKRTIAVAMSGGVDSSVAALLLKEQGHDVFGLFMKNWEEVTETAECPAARDYEDVVRVCEQIGIPHFALNFAEEYRDQVFADFLKELQAGKTPNPDILCNREIKFKVLLEKATALGADELATGHYARLLGKGSERRLYKGLDPGKDQSYFLYAVPYKAFSNVLFPVGDLLKTDLRALATSAGLATSAKKDSTGICFVGERDFRTFLSQHIAYQPGTFKVLETGETVGKHNGVAYYTIGQRKGMGIGGRGDAWFVVGKDLERAIVYVVQGSRHPALFCDALIACGLTWLLPEEPSQFPFQCHCKIRYRQADQACTIEKIEGGRAYVTFSVPQRAVTLSQSIVFYQGDICLGGGVIEEAAPSYYALGKQVPQEAV